MSITYPETQSSRASKSPTGPTVGGGSALFPGGAANLYDGARGSRARGGKGTPIAWVAAPVALVLIGGAIALSLPHHAAAPGSHATITTTTSTTPQPLAQAAASPPAASQAVNAESVAPPPAPVAPVTQKTVAHIATQDEVRTTTARGGKASSTRTVTRSATTETLPTGPVAYDQTPAGQGGQATVSPQAPPTATPGNFAFTAPATGPNGAQPAPAAPTAAPAGQPAPQATAAQPS
jgi:hypothetical protein